MSFGKWHEEFGKFSPEYTKVSKLLASYCLKLTMYELKIYKGVMRHDNEEWCKNWRGIVFVNSKLTWGIWEILTRALENVKNLHFNGLLLPKVHNVWSRKEQRSYVWWHWTLMQNLKENWLSKMTWGIQQIFTRACWKV